MSWDFSLPWWLFIVDWAIRLSTALLIIMRRRPVTASLAWLVVVLFVPVIGLLLYVLVGESTLGRRRAARHEKLTKNLDQKAVGLWRHRHQDCDTSEATFGPIARYGTAMSGLPPLRSNRLTLMADNQAMLASLERDIDAAKHHVHLLFYIWSPDSGVEAIATALERAARRGVQCRVLVDSVGGRPFFRSAMCRKMREAGVQVVESLPVRLWRLPFARVDLRNHRKIAVFDGRVAYCGSQNMCDTSFRSNRWRKTGEWIDASVRVEGPAAQALAVTFLRDWQLDSDEDLTDVEPFLPDVSPDPDHDCIVQVVPSGPGPTPFAIHQALLTLVYSAREELLMCTPYFVPDESMLEALRAAAARGVDVTIVMPRVSDSPLVASASRSHYLDLLEAGVKIYLYEGGLLHAKTLTVDRHTGVIGSTNIDQRSFFLNFEITLFVYDDDFASVLRFKQTGYLQDSERVHLDEWRKRTWAETLRDNAAQLLGPLL